MCIFSQKLSLETSTTVYYSTTCYYATTSGVCKNSVKIPSCTPPQASSKSTTLQQLMSIFRISPFQHSVFKSNPAGTGLEKNQYLIHHSGWLQTSVMFPIYSATDKRVVGNGQVPETESLKTFVYLFVYDRKLFVSIYFRLGSFHDHLSYLSLANTRGRFCSFVFVILRIHYYYYSVRSDLIKRCCKKVRWKKIKRKLLLFSYYLLQNKAEKKHCFLMSNPTDHCTFLSSSMYRSYHCAT